MSPYLAYLLGLVTALIILIPFWFIATKNATLRKAYAGSVCWKICE